MKRKLISGNFHKIIVFSPINPGGHLERIKGRYQYLRYGLSRARDSWVPEREAIGADSLMLPFAAVAAGAAAAAAAAAAEKVASGVGRFR